MKAVHGVFDCFEQIAQARGHRVLFITEQTPNREKLYSWIPQPLLKQIAYQMIKGWDMACEVFKHRDYGHAVILEHKPQYAAALYGALLLCRTRAFFFVHGIQQLSNRSLAHRSGFLASKFLVAHANFHPLHLERSDDCLSPPLRYKASKSIQVPHPLRTPPARAATTPGRKRRIGVAGMIRSDKPLGKIVSLGLEYAAKHPEVEFCIGTPKWAQPDWVANLGAVICDTGSDEAYDAFLGQLDVLLADFDRESFEFRPSGIINDALTFGCTVICPRFPTFEAQINTPVKVGLAFDRHEDIPDLITEALATREGSEERTQAWRAYRNNDGIYDAIWRGLQGPDDQSNVV